MPRVDCKDWADARVRKLRGLGHDARLLRIEPVHGRWISDFYLENGTLHPESMNWSYHYAVIVSNTVWEQSYEHPIDLEVYKSRFGYREGLRFTVLPATSV